MMIGRMGERVARVEPGASGSDLSGPMRGVLKMRTRTMRGMGGRRIWTCLVLAKTLALPAIAQDNVPTQDIVEVKEIKGSPSLLSMLMMGLLIAAAIGANAIPSKRGHQD